MKLSWRAVIVAIFLAGLLLTGLIGTSTSMTFIWPGYFLIGVAAVLSVGRLFREVHFTMPRWTTLSVFALSTYIMIRASESPVAYFAREDAALIVAGFLVYAGFLTLCTRSGSRRGMVFALVGLVIANLFLGLCQWLIDPQMWILPGYERTYTDQAGGLFNQPDHFASFLAILVPLWLSISAFGRYESGKRIAWLGLGIVCSLVVLVSGSMIGLLTLGAGLIGFSLLSILVLWKRLKPEVRRKGTIALSFLFLAGAVGLYAASGPISHQLGHGLFSKNGEASLPLVWEASAKQVAESPWLGTGSRSSYIYGRAFRSANLDDAVKEPEFAHNEFLQILADYGLIGLALMLVMVGLHFGNGFKFVKAYADVKPPQGGILPRSHHLALTLGAMSSVIALSCLALFDFALHLPVFAVVGALLLAVTAAPDPMADALKKKAPSTLPGGSLLFATRAITLGCGLAMVGMGFLFTRSEYHYEKARLVFEEDSRDFKQFRHLQAARSLDPMNPFAYSLSAHAQVAGITAEMQAPARRQALEKADEYFNSAQKLYPQDVFAAVGHAAVLDELGKKSLAGERLEDAQEWAPLYGNLMLAEAEHHLRYGEVYEAEASFEAALSAGAFRNSEAAMQGLRTISEWKLIAQQDGIRWQDSPLGSPNAEEGRRDLPEAIVDRRTVAGQAQPNATEPNAEEKPAVLDSAPKSSGVPVPPTW
tara:strand:- start:805 stop:2919 length:2115 start_codon:yes stop_codon:yes gene_type:complete